MPKVWLITGAGSGLGHHITEAALAAGHRVVAGARRLEQLQPLVERCGRHILPVTLDVRREEDAQAAVSKAMDAYGRIDVLVNNAGYQRNAPFEQITSEEFRDVVETCLFGVVYTTRAVLPSMRQRRSGRIFQVSSIGGRVAIPGNSPYHAAKWAVGEFSDSIAAEVAPLGIQVCTLEPGGMRTNFAQRAAEDLPALMPDYEESVGAFYRTLAQQRSGAQSDPMRVADLIVRLADAETLPKRLILGESANDFVTRVERERAEEAEHYRDLTLSTGFLPSS